MASVVEPGSVDEVATLLRDASRDGLAVIPRGGGTKLDWGRPPRRADLVLSTVRLDRVLEHAWGDMTATVEAGCTVARLQHALAEHGQRLACDPLWPERATIGGILAASDNGPLRARFGALRDLIIGVTLVLADGTVAKSGGKVVKNVAGYDLPKLATGSFGTLAVITQAVFRLHPLPRDTRTLTFTAPAVEPLCELALAIQGSHLAFVALQLRASASGAWAMSGWKGEGGRVTRWLERSSNCARTWKRVAARSCCSAARRTSSRGSTCGARRAMRCRSCGA